MSDKNIQQKKDSEKIPELLLQLPYFVKIFYEGYLCKKSPRTAYIYMRIYYVYCDYLVNNIGMLSGKNLSDLSINDLSVISKNDAAEFLKRLQHGEIKDTKKSVCISTVNTYISALNSMFDYFYRVGYIEQNPFSASKRCKTVTPTKSHKLNNKDAEKLLYCIVTGEGLNANQLAARIKYPTALRDHLVCNTLLSLGLNISELIELNIEDVDIAENRIRISKDRIIEIDNTLRDEIYDYLVSERPLLQPGHNEKALFLSSRGINRGGRITVNSINNIIKKYCKAAGISNANRISAYDLRYYYMQKSIDENTREILKFLQKKLGITSLSELKKFL